MTTTISAEEFKAFTKRGLKQEMNKVIKVLNVEEVMVYPGGSAIIRTKMESQE